MAKPSSKIIFRPEFNLSLFYCVNTSDLLYVESSTLSTFYFVTTTKTIQTNKNPIII